MKTKVTNTLMYASGLLLLAAATAYLLKWSSVFVDGLLITASIVAGYPTVVKAWKAARLKMFSIELLVAIAVIGALIIGEYVESAAVTFLFLFGAFLEARSLEKARSSLKSLIDLAPLTATVLRNGIQQIINADEVVENDVVLVQTGEKIPADGKIIHGTGYINEAAITGESIPVEKTKGAKVFSGSILDSGFIEVIAENVGADTTFSKIIELVEEAQEGKAKSQRFLEKFAAIYTPAIIGLSFLVWLITRDIHLSLTFLVIACPGALVISTPVSIVAGIGNGARNGILIKGGEVMENLAKLNAIAFDKTGTLTMGKPTVTAIQSFGIDKNELLRLTAEAEMVSEHHLAKAIVEEAKQQGLELKNKPEKINILKGRGMEAELEGRKIYIGNRKGLEERNIFINEAINTYAEVEEKKGNTAVFVSDFNDIIGVISISDKIREAAQPTIKELRHAGVQRLVMLTGDNEHTAKLVGETLGMDHVFANLLPEDKLTKVQACMGKGVKLGMIGDGVNDAPAIAAADVGIAMGAAGTDAAMETADVILMADKLDKLVHALKLAKATSRNMKQNMTIAIFTVFVLLVGVLTKNVNLASGMLLHELSVLLVILNAIRLIRFNPNSLRYKIKEKMLSQKNKSAVKYGENKSPTVMAKC